MEKKDLGQTALEECTSTAYTGRDSELRCSNAVFKAFAYLNSVNFPKL